MQTNCPHCDYTLKVKEEWLGRKVKCPSCKEGFRIPEEIPKAKPTKKSAKSSSSTAKKSKSATVAKSSSRPTKGSKAAAPAKTAKTAKTASAAATASKKKTSAPGKTAPGKAGSMAKAGASGAPKKKRARPQQGNPYKGMVNTLLIIGICAPYIFFHHNKVQAARVQEFEAVVAQNEEAKKEIARRKVEEREMKRNAAASAREQAKEAKLALNAEAEAQLKAEETELAEKAFKVMLDHFIAMEEQMVKEREEMMAGLKKAIAAETLKNKKLDVGQMQQAKDPFFKDNVINVFMNRCHKCHGNEEAKGGLRLHTRDFTLQGGDGGPSVVPGNPEESFLYELIILDEDDDDIMPPKGGKLTDEEIAAIKKWIEDGAKW